MTMLLASRSKIDIVVACTDETCGRCKFKVNGWCELFNCAIIEGRLRCAPCFRAEKELEKESYVSYQGDFIAEETAKALGWKLDKDGFLIHSCGDDEERAQNIWNAEYNRQKDKVRRG